MNQREARVQGRANGIEAGNAAVAELGKNASFDDLTKEALENETCGRQYAGHVCYDFNREPNYVALWEAYEDGVIKGIIAAIKSGTR